MDTQTAPQPTGPLSQINDAEFVKLIWREAYKSCILLGYQRSKATEYADEAALGAESGMQKLKAGHPNLQARFSIQ